MDLGDQKPQTFLGVEARATVPTPQVSCEDHPLTFFGEEERDEKRCRWDSTSFGEQKVVVA